MADGGEAVGNVMKNWPRVFEILNLLSERTSYSLSSIQGFVLHSLINIVYRMMYDHLDQSVTMTNPPHPTDPNASMNTTVDESHSAKQSEPLPQLVRLEFGGSTEEIEDQSRGRS